MRSSDDDGRDLTHRTQEQGTALEAAIQEGMRSGRSPRKAEAILAAAKARLRGG